MGTVPFSNPGGNNQTNPVSSMLPKGVAQMPTGAGAGLNPVQNNPYMPPSTANPIPIAAPVTSPGAQVPNAGGLINDPSNKYGTTGALDKQLKDIYGKGIGGALGDLLKNMSGVDSAALQEYIASLQPQMAKAQANVDTALGAGGVSQNSSVTAIADANLQAQETAAIAGEESKLTLGQEELTAQILSGMQGSAEKEVASSGWDVFAKVIDAASGVAGAFLGA